MDKRQRELLRQQDRIISQFRGVSVIRHPKGKSFLLDLFYKDRKEIIYSPNQTSDHRAVQNNLHTLRRKLSELTGIPIKGIR